MDEIERENQTLRRLVTELVMGKRHVQTGDENCATLEIPLPCECGAIVWRRFLFHPTPFTLTVERESIKVEGKPKEVSLHGITVQGSKVCCRECGREVKEKRGEQ